MKHSPNLVRFVREGYQPVADRMSRRTRDLLTELVAQHQAQGLEVGGRLLVATRRSALCARLHRSPRSISRSMAVLVSLGLVQLVKRGGGHADDERRRNSVYELTVPVITAQVAA